jgi:zinc/manganese transport system ATP-binding protein
MAAVLDTLADGARSRGAAATARAAAVTVDNLTISYRQHPAVHHLSCRFAAGSLTAVVGPNGAGKSSLLDALVGKLRPTTGQIHLGVDRRSQVAYLPQQSQIDRSFPLRVADVVMLGAWSMLGLFRGANAQVRRRADQALAEVGLGGFGQRQVGELSVGQFQRVLFARVLVQDAPLILLDEPFNAIDTRTTADLLALVHRWHAEGRTVLAVLHDLDQVRQHFPQALLLAREGLAFGPSAQVLTPDNLQRARALAELWDDAAAWCHRDPPPPLAVPDDAAAVHGPAHGAGHGHHHRHPHADHRRHDHPGHGHPALPTERP